MSFDIWLRDPITNKVAEVPGHLMIGGTYLADYHLETRTFTPALNTNAELNITYNYSHYYNETYKDLGIRAIYGISGLDSIPMLEKMIENIKRKYLNDEVENRTSEYGTSNYWDSTAANAVKPLYQLIALAKMRPKCVWDGD